MASDLYRLPAKDIARLVRGGEIRAREVTEAYLARAHNVDPRLGAFVTIRDDRALVDADAVDGRLARLGARAHLPLAGVTLTVKDAIDVAGERTTSGSLGLVNNIATRDAEAVAQLRRAGAVVIGKTNLPEFCLAWETDNRIVGRTVNPHDAARSPGGSSGGEAAALAVGASALGLGSDSGGSLRIPAHSCGVASLKPTAGRVSRSGHIPPPAGSTDSFVQVGPMARFIGDLELVLPVISGGEARDTSSTGSLRVAICYAAAFRPVPAVAQMLDEIRIHVAERGYWVSVVDVPDLSGALDVHMGVTSWDGGVGLMNLLAQYGTQWSDRSPFIDLLTERIAKYKTDEAGRVAAIERANAFRAHMAASADRWDLLVLPASPTGALVHGQSFDEEHWKGFGLVAAFNVTGWPVVTVRGGWDEVGLPLGVQVVAAPWRDETALRLAAEIEQSAGSWVPVELP